MRTDPIFCMMAMLMIWRQSLYHVDYFFIIRETSWLVDNKLSIHLDKTESVFKNTVLILKTISLNINQKIIYFHIL